MKVGFAELGRVQVLAAPDDTFIAREAAILLNILARECPEWEFVTFGRCESGNIPYPNIVNPWPAKCPRMDEVRRMTAEFLEPCDAAVIFINQNSTVTQRNTPRLDGTGRYVKPLSQAVRSCGPIINAINEWRSEDDRRDVIWLMNDPRSPLHVRDLAHHEMKPLIAPMHFEQHTYIVRNGGNEPTVRGYQYHAPETLAALDVTVPLNDDFARPFHLILCQHEQPGRAAFIRKWCPVEPHIHGQWSENVYGKEIIPISRRQVYGALQLGRATFMSENRGMVSLKVWEAFAAGTVCFCPPGYDDQGHVLHGELGKFLRVTSPEDFRHKLNAVTNSPSLWRDVIVEQRGRFDAMQAENQCINYILRRLWNS